MTHCYTTMANNIITEGKENHSKFIKQNSVELVYHTFPLFVLQAKRLINFCILVSLIQGKYYRFVRVLNNITLILFKT